MSQINDIPDHYPAWTWQMQDEPKDLALKNTVTVPLAKGDVLVRNAVIGLNPVDWKVLTGALVNWEAGKVPGVDGAGTVVAVGDGVSGNWVGRRVAYHQSLALPGSFAAYTPVPARALMPIPDALDFHTAASFPCPGLTAWQALGKIPASSGARILISGAGGAVGHFLVQLAVARGFDVSVLCNARHWERLRSLGASNARHGPLADDNELPEALQGRFHAVIDAVNSQHAERLVPALQANGHLVCIEGRLENWPNPPFGQALSLHEVALGALHNHGNDEAWHQLTQAGEELLQAMADKQLQPETRHIRPFSELPAWLDALKHRQFSGKALVEL
ncbi:zinc-binding dehydrogenase [Marinobacter sp. JSM 1782161]|uniref:zinc-binding dehydrogenase n=1 Tax=Marinobacter sp. JSM 1782161 TaxID=2685906 RepID=UPI001A9DEB0F|nr:zinc-binding dehydrogenase [Marinobacter sp. JSM 1782161]